MDDGTHVSHALHLPTDRQVQWIADRDRPSFQGWKNGLGQADERGKLALKQDYAIISQAR
jgi:hypothetical protein